MAEQSSRIASLLNARPANATLLNAAPADGSSGTSSGSSSPVSYQVAAGKDATATQLGRDSSPNALITVDGHKVAQGDDGLGLVIDPKGATNVTYSPSDSTVTANGQTSTAGTQTVGQTQDGTQSGVTQAGAQSNQGTGQDGQGGVQNLANGSQGTSTLTDANATNASAGGTGTGANATNTSATGQDGQTQIQHLSAGDGKNDAKLDLAVHGANGDTAPQMTPHKDGSFELNYANGYGNGHDLKVHVKPQADGSLDVQIPKGPDNPHDVNIHVNHGKHLDLNLTRDADGNFRIATHDHKQDQDGDWAGLKEPVGKDGKPVTGDGQDGTGNGADTGDGQNGTGTGDGQNGTGNGLGDFTGAGKNGTGSDTGTGAGDGTGGLTGGGGTGGGGTGGLTGGGGTGGGGTGTGTGKDTGTGTGKDTGTDKDTGNGADTGDGNTGHHTYDQSALGDLQKYLYHDDGPVPKFASMTTKAGNLNSQQGLGFAAEHMGLGASCKELHDTIKNQFQTGHDTLAKWWTTNLNYTGTNNANADAQTEDYLNKVNQQYSS